MPPVKSLATERSGRRSAAVASGHTEIRFFFRVSVGLFSVTAAQALPARRVRLLLRVRVAEPWPRSRAGLRSPPDVVMAAVKYCPI